VVVYTLQFGSIAQDMRDKIFFLFFSVIILCSCISKPEWKNPFDPKADISPGEWAPSNLEITQITVCSAKLSWNQSENRIVGFRIERKIDNGPWSIIAIIGKSEREWIDYNVIPDSTKTHYYRIYAYAGDNVSDYIEGSIRPSFPEPSNLVITQVSVDTLRLDWKDNSIGEDGFIIDKRIEDGNWIENYGIVGENITAFIDTNIISNKTSYYRVCAYKGMYLSKFAEGSFTPSLP